MTEPSGKTYVGSDKLYEDVQRTMQLAAEMNSGYHSEAEVRDYLRKITGRDIDPTVRVFAPLHVNYGPGVSFGHVAHSLRHFLRGEPECHYSDTSVQILQTQG